MNPFSCTVQKDLLVQEWYALRLKDKDIRISGALRWFEHVVTFKDISNDCFIQPSTSRPVIYTKVQVHMHVTSRAVPLSKVPKYLGTSLISHSYTTR